MVCRKRCGLIVVIAAVLLVVMVAMVAFAVDLGFICVVRTELQAAADAAALAGVSALPKGKEAAITTSTAYVGLNTQVVRSPTISNSVGQWNFETGKFSADKSPFNALQVMLDTKNQAMFFGKALGRGSFNAGATATAIIKPRDIVLVLDFSGSMNSQQKVNQLKASTALFCDVLDELGTQDRVGFCKYSSAGELVVPLTGDFDKVNQEVQATKATGWTNIYEGIKLAREELQSNGRANATKMMVIMTDGLANRPPHLDPKAAVISEAQASHALGIDLFTISFGADADKTLMVQVADIADDIHFAVDGNVETNGELLRDVFVKIANKRKVFLVQ